MPPKQWDDEESSDVDSDWEAADEKEVIKAEAERKAAEAKAKAEAEAAANRKPRSERIQEHIAAKKIAADAQGDDEEEETEQERRNRLRREQLESDLSHAEEMFGGIGNIAGRKSTAGCIVPLDSSDSNNTIDLSTLPIFKPVTRSQFDHMAGTVAAVLGQSSSRPHYPLVLPEMFRQLVKDLSSEQVKKIASALTAVSNEKMKAEKAAEKGGKKTKGAKKTVLSGINKNGKLDGDDHMDGGELVDNAAGFDDDFM